MVSYEATKRKYRGKMASGYVAKRSRQERWHRENELVQGMLRQICTRRSVVLDCPVGAGRFLPTYAPIGCRVVGVDSSDEMLALAAKELRRLQSGDRVRLTVGDAVDLDHADESVDVAVCVRFLDLVPQSTMRAAVAELCRAARRHVILTIRLGDAYVEKVNTATHDSRGFRRLVTTLGWRVAEEYPIFNQGWTVLRLERSK